MSLVFFALAISFGVSVMITAIVSRYRAVSIEQTREELRLAAEAERAIRAEVSRMLGRNDITAGLADTLTKHIDDPALHPPEGLDTDSLTAAELQWLADVGELAWAENLLAERVNRAIETLAGKAEEAPKPEPPHLIEPFLRPGKLDRESDRRIAREIKLARSRKDRHTASKLVLELYRRGGRVEYDGEIVLPQDTGSSLIKASDCAQARETIGPFSRWSDEELVRWYDRAWADNELVDVDPLATEIRRRGGRIDGYGNVVLPEPGSTEPLPYQ